MTDEKKDSLQLLQEYLDKTPKEKLDKIFADIDAMEIEGPTLEEYFNPFAHLQNKIARLTSQLETERMRLAACGVAARSNTEESIKANRLPTGSPYYSASYSDTCDAVDREMKYRSQLGRAKELLEQTTPFVQYIDDKLLAQIEQFLKENQ